MKISVIGPPGSGKTTQGQLLAQKLSLLHISMGGVCREVAEQDTDEGRQVKAALEKGILVDDDLVLKLFYDRISQSGCQSGFIADGNPRTLHQAQKMEEQSPFDKVVFIRVSLVVAKERLLKRGRADDTEGTITRRFRIFSKQIAPILDFYREKGKLVEVDGDGSVEAVAKETMAKLGYDD